MSILLWIGCLLLCVVAIIVGMFVCAMAILLLEVVEDFGYDARRTETITVIQRSRPSDSMPVLRRR